jgi:2-polyprenyl-6-methoxyphenol hydroxylase-like FAD-dependent oxidoreductase
VGDAGYFKDPITSHGITDALRDAELLARAIISSAGGADEVAALASYEATRDRFSTRLFRTTDTIASFAWTIEQIPLLLLELSDSMSDEVKWLSNLDPVSHGVH